jgi:hypothetical protein
MMRNPRVENEACQSLGVVQLEGSSPDEKTTTVSVATMRRLVAHSAAERAERPSDAPDRSVARARSFPNFLGKSGAILVLPQPKSRSRVIAEPESEARVPEAPASAPVLVSRETPARSDFRPKAMALLSDSERRRKRSRARSFLGRLLTVAMFSLVVLSVAGALWGRNVGGVRERVAAATPVLQALLERGTAFLSQ